jgi:pimeloyl-ACP methyl ester carboxylesterase
MKPLFNRVVTMFISVFLLNGCMLFRLHEDLEKKEHFSTVSGVVKSDSPHGKPIQVLAIAGDAQNFSDKSAMRRMIMLKPGPFKLFLPPGRYVMGAFEDANEDGFFQSDEYVGWHGAPDTIESGKGKETKDLTIVLRSPTEARKELPILYEVPRRTTASSDRIHLGDVVNITDSRFSTKNGEMGLWEPIKFMEEVGGGIYFLEPYAANKIPVLFVHGAAGNPSSWKQAIAALDRKRFQPWLLYYPSGLRLDTLRGQVANLVAVLESRYKFKRLYVVAHSMGGILSRGFINLLIEEKKAEYINLFITLSTPWGGHEMASAGVDNSPVIVPSWYDMVPESPYLQMLFNKPFPSYLEYYLFFSHRGGVDIMTGGNTDGTVSLQSQLVLPAQQSATQIRGFHEDHTSILSSPVVIDQLNQLLENR